jgi:hypothetical protein
MALPFATLASLILAGFAAISVVLLWFRQRAGERCAVARAAETSALWTAQHAEALARLGALERDRRPRLVVEAARDYGPSRGDAE